MMICRGTRLLIKDYRSQKMTKTPPSSPIHKSDKISDRNVCRFQVLIRFLKSRQNRWLIVIRISKVIFRLWNFDVKAEWKFLPKNHILVAPKCLEPVIMIYSRFRAISLAKSENLSSKPSDCLDQSHDSVLPIKQPFDLSSCQPGPIRTPNPTPKKGIRL